MDVMKEGAIINTGFTSTDIFGTWKNWQQIYKLNRDIIKDPDLIYPDVVLKIIK
jgi:hypothetical protein